jgi:hypothetical protein
MLFYRWLWLVYFPLAVSPLLIVLAFLHLLPPLVLFLLIWDLLCVRLLVERRRRQLALPIPRRLITGLVALALLVLTGVILMLMGLNRLSGRGGPKLLVAGAFLALLAAFAPVFKLVDVTLRFVGRTLLEPREPAEAERQKAA